MGRWSDMDSDAERLPAGFERIGYDADTQTYTFRDSDGNTYESEPGNRYGELHRVGSAAPSFASSATLTEEYSDDAPSKGTREPARTFDDMLCEQERAMKRGNREAVRMMLPFALLVLVFLILVFKLVNRSDQGATAPKEDSIDCGQDGHPIVIHKGDTCWDIAQTFGITVKELLALHGNDAIDCDRLAIGKGVCVPT